MIFENTLFDVIKIEEELWQFLLESQQSDRVSKLVNIIENYYVNSIICGSASSTRQVKKLAGEHCYKLRYSHADRIAIKIYQKNETLVLLMSKILSHKDAEKLHNQEYNFTSSKFRTVFKIDDFDDFKDELTFEPIPSQYITYSIGRIWTPEDEQRIKENLDAELRRALNDAQDKFLDNDGPLLIKGSAGSGKTTVSLYRLIKFPGKRKLYVTLTRSLKLYAKECFQKLTNNIEFEMPDFMTIEELCLSVINRENKFKSNNKLNFELFRDLNFIRKACIKYRLDPFILWEEIRGVLKQSDSELTRKEYLELTPDNHIAEAVLSVYPNYCEYLETKQVWDDVDLAREALDNASTYFLQEYDVVIVDEVQDLTETQVKLICHLCQTPIGIFMAGDESQSIHPSKFDWEKLKNNVQNSFVERGYNTSPKICFLSENFRSPKPIFELSQLICQWRQKLFNLKETDVYAVCRKQDGEPVYLLEPDILKDYSWDILPYNVMVIVPSEELREEAVSKFGIGSVLTIYEAKGLENKIVILYRFFEDSQFKRGFNFLFQLLGISSQSQSFSTLLNILNVAVTRSEKCLYIVSSPKTVYSIKVLGNYPFVLNNGLNLIELLNSHINNPDGYFSWAKKLELAGAYLQAEANYLKAFDLGYSLGKAYAYKCSGMLKKLKHQYIEAQKDFEAALETNDENILRELYECEGILELENGNLTLASEKLKAAHISLGEIIQKILSANEQNKYHFALKLILEQDINYLEEFLSNNDNIKHLDFERKILQQITTEEEAIELCMKYLINFLKKELSASTSAFNELYKNLEYEQERIPSKTSKQDSWEEEKYFILQDLISRMNEIKVQINEYYKNESYTDSVKIAIKNLIKTIPPFVINSLESLLRKKECRKFILSLRNQKNTSPYFKILIKTAETRVKKQRWKK